VKIHGLMRDEPTIEMHMIGGPKDGEVYANVWPPSALVKMVQVRADSPGPCPENMRLETGYYRRKLTTFEIEPGMTTFDYVWEGWR
jgi:hypothetical protein